MEEEDDEFGELYSDVLIPPPSSSSANQSLDFRFRSEDDDSDVFNASIPFSNLKPSSQTLAPISQPNQDLTPDFSPKASTLPHDDGIKDPEQEQKEIEQLDRVSNHQTGVSVSGSISVTVSSPSGDGVRVSERREVDKGENGAFNGEKVEIDVPIADLDSEPVIPGLSTGTVVGFASAEATKIIDKRVDSGGGDDWDSDSEDELQIVLNDNTAPLGADRNQGMEMDDEDDEDGEDLVIVADNEAPLSQPNEEPDWGEDLAPSAVDGERKEGGDAIKVNGGMGGPFGVRIGYTNHGYHQHHSQFKYVRPGAAGGPGSTPGQVRPLIAMGPVTSQGRGDWRMMGIKSMGNMQKSFHPGYGPPVWANNSSVRPYGSGMDFTLPSHKTVFDIDIDSFEEKPWRLPVVDISDYFNFGLDEDTWKDYCKQLEQLRLEASMQGKIRVYESGRSEQDYDPDLPPELAAAAGLHDISVDNANLGKTDGGQADSVGLGRGAAYIQRQLPTGRAIQVEGGYGERLPSIDTRPPRNRDSDSVIEIVLQDSVDDDSITSNGTLEQTESEAQVDLKKGHKVEEPSYFNRFQQTYCDKKREATSGSETFMGRNQDNILDGGRILPFMSEIPINHLARSNVQGQTPPADDFDNSQGGRWIKGTSQERYPQASSKTLNSTKSTHSAQMKKFDGHQREKSVDSFGGKQPSEAVSPNKVKAVRQPSIEQKEGVDEQLALADSAEVEGDEITSDLGVPSEIHEESNLIHSLGKQKLSSRVEPAVQENENGDGLRPSGSDSSKARSGGSRDYQKRREGGEEEVIHDGRSKRTREERRARDDSGRGYPRRDEYGRDGRQEMDRTQTTARLKEDFGHSYPHREWDSSSGHYSRAKAEGFERQMETDSSVGVRQRRDDEIHVRRAKDEEIMRRRDIVEEAGSRHKNMIRESERKEKDEHLFSRKRVDDAELRGRHEKDLGPSRQRQRDDILLGRHEGLDDPHFKRRKDEVLHRREHEKEDGLHGYRSREDRRKRERDDVVDPRRRDSQVKLRDKPDDHHHSARQREESRRQREREDRQKVKQLQEESKWVGSGRGKEESKGLGSDKDYSHRDKRRQIEESKRRERVEEETSSQHREREDKSHENQFNNEEWNSRHERLSGQNDRSVGQYKERDRDTSRKNKESEVGDHNTSGPVRKKLDDHSSRKNEKVTTKSTKQQESTAVPGAGLVDSRSHELPRSSSAVHSGKGHHRRNEPKRPSVIDGEDVPSDEDIQHNSRKGRSKFERWTSHKERDLNPNPQTSSPKANKDTEKHINDASVGTKQHVESDRAADAFNNENAEELEPKDAVMVPSSDNLSVEPDKVGDDGHLDTVAKLKKRSERFKLPLLTEKDTTTSRKVEIEAVVAHSVSTLDAEVKQERPARKRRWVSS